MLNKAQIIGHLGNDPEVRHTQSGTCVCEISVATTERWKDQNGDQQERTEWHRVTFWGKLGEIAGEYLRKGARVYVEGKLQTEKWTDREGVDRYTTKIVGSDMKMLDRREGSNDNAPRQQRQERQERPAPQQRQAPQQPPMDDYADDDIPF